MGKYKTRKKGYSPLAKKEINQPNVRAGSIFFFVLFLELN
jgi:hypothetical protein